MRTIMPFLIIGVCIGMYFVYIKPSFDTITIKREKYAEYEEVINKVREVKDKKDQLASAYESISEENLDKLSKIIPEKFDSVTFGNDINSMSTKYGMKIKSLRTTIVETNENTSDLTEFGGMSYKTVTANFNLNGRYDQFISFLTDLETNLRIVDVTDLDIRSSGKDSKDVNLDFNVAIRTYSLK